MYTDQQIEDAIAAIMDRAQNKAVVVRTALSMFHANLQQLVIPAGAKFLFAAGAPDAALGKEGDVYDNTATGDRFQKQADGSWKFQYRAKGADGRTPVKGKDYTDGYAPRKGVDYFDGQDGKSAYQLWLDAGNVGNVAAFLASLQAKPTNGADGTVYHQQSYDPAATDGGEGDIWQTAVSLSTERRWQKIGGTWRKFYDNTAVATSTNTSPTTTTPTTTTPTTTTPTNTPPAALVQVGGTSSVPKFTATATDNDGIQSIFVKVFNADGTVAQTFGPSAVGDTSYVTSWTNAPAGSYTAKAVATDSKNATTTSDAVSFTVAPAATSTNPVVYDMTLAGQFGHTIQNFDTGKGYRKRTGMAQSPSISTDAPSLTVRLVSEMIALGYGANRATVDVFVDGAYYSTVQATAAAATDYPVQLPNDGKSHTVYFVEGLAMYATGSTYGGTYLVSVTVPAGSSSSLAAFVRKSKRLAYSTDSIIAGDHASSPARAIMLQQRTRYPGWEIADIGFCGRTATEAWDTDDLQNAQVSAVTSWLSGAAEKVYAVQLGANDANQNRDAQGYQTRLALVTDKVHAADKDVKVGLVRPFYTNYSGLNDSTLQVLRDRMQTVASQRPNFCHFIDTSSDITSSNSGQYQADGLHLNDDGHAYEAPILGQELTSLPVNTADVVVANNYQKLAYGRVFTDLQRGPLNGQDSWNQNSGSYQVTDQGLEVNAVYSNNATGILYAKQQFGNHRIVLRVSRLEDPRIFLVARHDTSTLNKTGFWITGESDERYDTGFVNGASVQPFAPAIANEVPLNRSEEFLMEIEFTDGKAYYRSYVPGPNNDESNRPNSAQAMRSLPSSISSTGYVGLLTTGPATVLVKEIRIYTA